MTRFAMLSNAPANATASSLPPAAWPRTIERRSTRTTRRPNLRHQPQFGDMTKRRPPSCARCSGAALILPTTTMRGFLARQRWTDGGGPMLLASLEPVVNRGHVGEVAPADQTLVHQLVKRQSRIPPSQAQLGRQRERGLAAARFIQEKVADRSLVDVVQPSPDHSFQLPRPWRRTPATASSTSSWLRQAF